MPKKVRPTKSVSHHEKNAKAVVALLMLALAFFVYMLFKMYQETLLASPDFKMFVLLLVVLFGLMVGLLYLLSPSRR